jgi:MFS family permease
MTHAADPAAALLRPESHRMTALERRASGWLASIYALRMLGLFIVLPVFALQARHYPGGDDPVWVGLAMGIYGLTQALLQLPLGAASDAWGRKRVIVAGLAVFAVGSALAAIADTLALLTLGRALQGAGAVSAAVTALLADFTRDSVRTKAMAMVGASIGATFALSLLLAPLLGAAMGLDGLFALTAVLAMLGMAVVMWLVPPEPPRPAQVEPAPFWAGLRRVLADRALVRLNVGVFVLHAVLLAMWLHVPVMLGAAGLPAAQHAWVYLPAVLLSFAVMGAVLFPLERRGHLRAVFLAAIGLLLVVQMALAWAAQSQPSVALLAAVLTVFFVGFNVLEATQPSLASRLAPATLRGTTMGVYNTLQSLGFFVGGSAGGWLLARGGPLVLYGACAFGLALWLVLAWGMSGAPTRRA